MKTSLGFVIAATVGGLVLGFVSPASADPAVARQAIQVAASVQAAGTADVLPASQTTQDSNSALIERVNGATVTIPKDPSIGVTVSTPSGQRIDLDLPNASSAYDAKTTDSGTAVYADPASDSAVAVQATTGGGLRALITLSSKEAKTDYTFHLRVPNGYRLQLDPDGSAQVVNIKDPTDGLAFINRPWARDAKGVAIPTSYSVSGNKLIQHVATTSSTTYPVVADPWVQGDCGWVTCTIRFDRASTRNARDAGWLIGAAAGMCAVLTGGILAVVCGAAIGPSAVIIAVYAGRYYESGNCLQIKVTKSWPAAAWPGSVKRGTRNCR